MALRKLIASSLFNFILIKILAILRPKKNSKKLRLLTKSFPILKNGPNMTVLVMLLFKVVAAAVAVVLVVVTVAAAVAATAAATAAVLAAAAAAETVAAATAAATMVRAIPAIPRHPPLDAAAPMTSRVTTTAYTVPGKWATTTAFIAQAKSVTITACTSAANQVMTKGPD